VSRVRMVGFLRPQVNPKLLGRLGSTASGRLPPNLDGDHRSAVSKMLDRIEVGKQVSQIPNFSRLLKRSESYARLLPFSPHATCRSSFPDTPSSIEHAPSAWHFLCLTGFQMSNTCDQSQ
jgi:hypothetical protein